MLQRLEEPARPPAGSGRPALVYDEAYQRYDFGSAHALQEVRGKLAHDLIVGIGLAKAADERRPKAASEADLLTVHEPPYVNVVKRLSRDPSMIEPEFGLEPGDNPPFEGMYEAAALQVGGPLLACELVPSGGERLPGDGDATEVFADAHAPTSGS